MKTKYECFDEFEDALYTLEKRNERCEITSPEYYKQLKGLRDKLAQQLGINLNDAAKEE